MNRSNRGIPAHRSAAINGPRCDVSGHRRQMSRDMRDGKPLLREGLSRFLGLVVPFGVDARTSGPLVLVAVGVAELGFREHGVHGHRHRHALNPVQRTVNQRTQPHAPERNLPRARHPAHADARRRAARGDARLEHPQRRAALDRRRSRSGTRAHGLGAQRLLPHVRRPAAGLGSGGRCVRPTTDVPDRRRGPCDRVRARHAGLDGGGAHRRVSFRAPGRRCSVRPPCRSSSRGSPVPRDRAR